MTSPRLIITKLDQQRLEPLLTDAIAQRTVRVPYLETLRQELERATIVSSDDVPVDVITMNSQVDLYDKVFDVTETYTLVYPDDADPFSNRLSFMNPMGAVILGRRSGDVVCWQNSSGEHQLELRKLSFQPEREGVLNL